MSDINECAEIPGACTQDCENTQGSYICKCRDGYRKAPDGKTCKKIDGKIIMGRRTTRGSAAEADKALLDDVIIATTVAAKKMI